MRGDGDPQSCDVLAVERPILMSGDSAYGTLDRQNHLLPGIMPVTYTRQDTLVPLDIEYMGRDRIEKYS
jgi:hypothetical protein